jgi:hypothetical protein
MADAMARFFSFIKTPFIKGKISWRIFHDRQEQSGHSMAFCIQQLMEEYLSIRAINIHIIAIRLEGESGGAPPQKTGPVLVF